jgi:hypothetical protein
LFPPNVKVYVLDLSVLHIIILKRIIIIRRRRKDNNASAQGDRPLRDGSKANHPPLRRRRFARIVRFGGDVPDDTDGLHHPVLDTSLALSFARNLRK